MKNLENKGVHELSKVEIKNIDGGYYLYAQDIAENIGDAWDSFWDGFSLGKRD